MHVTTDIKAFSAALATVKPALSRQGGALPVLRHARLEAADGLLTITASDLDLSARISIPATVLEPGVVLAAGVELGKALKGKGRVDLSFDGTRLQAVNGMTSTIPSFDVADWPKLQMDATDESFSVDVDVEALRSVLVAASKDESRPILTGVLFRLEHGEAHIVATDSYRLHLVSFAPTAGWEKLAGDGVLIPARALIQAAAHTKTGTLSIAVVPNGYQALASQRIVVIAAADGSTWATRAIEGQFPNFWQLIPSDLPGETTFPRPAFEDALKHIADAMPPEIPVRMTSTPDGLRVWAMQHDGQEKEVVLPGFTDVDWAANPKYLLGAVQGLATCTIRVINALKPAMIQELNESGLHRRLIMPVRCA